MRLSNPDAVVAFLLKELDVDQADSIRPYLWIAGLPFSSIRPLHRNVVIQRKIVVCEQSSLHLVSHNEAIFVKPIPHCLLQHAFYREHITGKANNLKIMHRASAFLATYLYLIRHQSDFSIATQYGLLPSWVTWEQWLAFSAELSSALCDNRGRMMRFDGRYSHGELRLGRLNLIVRLKGNFRGYMVLDTQYSQYFSQFFGLLTLLTAVYISVVLSAFQVALATPLARWWLIHAGFWFSVIVLLLLTALICLPIIWFMIALVDNVTYAFRRKT